VSVFLTAEWRQLAMLNYELDASALDALVPRGTELDLWQGRCFASVVGFRFLDTRVLGVPVPFHRNFEEVNLRFYVRQKSAEGWRRGVAFVKEIVPRAAIAFVARTLYDEKYVALPMDHRVEHGPGGQVESVEYGWRLGGRRHSLSLRTTGEFLAPAEGSQEQFIAEHYWGYTARRDGGTSAYEVRHPPWRVVAAAQSRLDCDVARLYGERLAEALRVPPASAFLADGSEVSVSRGVGL